MQTAVLLARKMAPNATRYEGETVSKSRPSQSNDVLFVTEQPSVDGGRGSKVFFVEDDETSLLKFRCRMLRET